jgi:hypothetical protein
MEEFCRADRVVMMKRGGGDGKLWFSRFVSRRGYIASQMGW